MCVCVHVCMCVRNLRIQPPNRRGVGVEEPSVNGCEGGKGGSVGVKGVWVGCKWAHVSGYQEVGVIEV